MSATSEELTLLKDDTTVKTLPSSSSAFRNHPLISAAAVGTALVAVLIVALSWQDTDAQMPTNLRSIPLLSSSPEVSPTDECVSIMTGVYDSTCMIVGDGFAFPNGILGGLVLGAPSSSGISGIDYFLLSVDNDYLGPLYLERGHYTLDDSRSAVNATSNCAGQNNLSYRFTDDKDWSPLTLDMEWNTANGGKSFLLGTNDGFGCHYTKLSGSECSKVYKDIVKAFAKVGMDLNVPSRHHLCE